MIATDIAICYNQSNKLTFKGFIENPNLQIRRKQMKKGVIICTLLLFFGLCACGKSETLPASASDSMELESGTENNVPDPEQIQ